VLSFRALHRRDVNIILVFKVYSVDLKMCNLCLMQNQLWLQFWRCGFYSLWMHCKIVRSEVG